MPKESLDIPVKQGSNQAGAEWRINQSELRNPSKPRLTRHKNREIVKSRIDAGIKTVKISELYTELANRREISRSGQVRSNENDLPWDSVLAAYIDEYADDSVSIEEVRRNLSSVSRSLSDLVEEERNSYGY